MNLPAPPPSSLPPFPSAEASAPVPELFEMLFQSMMDGMIVLDAQRRIVMANAAMGVLTDRPIHALLGKTIGEAWGGQSPQFESDGTRSIVFEDRITRSDGRPGRYAAVRAFRLPNPERPYAAVYQDVTRLREVEARSRQSSEQFAFLVEKVTDGIVILQGGMLTYVNDRLATLLGYTPDELQGRPATMLFGAAVGAEPILQVPPQPGHHELPALHRNGSQIECEFDLTDSLYYGRPATFVVVRDIRERRRMERRTRLQLQMGQRLNVASSPRSAAQAMLEIADELVGWSACSVELIDQATPGKQSTIICMDTIGETRRQVPAPLVGATASDFGIDMHTQGAQVVQHGQRYKSSIFVPIRATEGNIGLLSLHHLRQRYTAEDALEVQALADHCGGAFQRTRTEDALRESEQRYREMFHRNSAVKLLVDPASGAIIDANAAALRYYNFSMDQLRQRKLSELSAAPPRHVADMLRRMCTAAEENSLHTSRHLLAEGRVRDVEIFSSLLHIRGRELLHFIVMDVTDRNSAMTEVEALSELGRRCSEARTGKGIARIVFDIAKRVIGGDAGFLDIFASDLDQKLLPGKPLMPVLHWDTINGEHQEVDLDVTLLPGSAITKRTLREGPQLVLRKQQQPQVPPGFAGFGDVNRASASLMYVPIPKSTGTGVMGVLSLQSYHHNAYSHAQLRLLQTFANHTAGALERIQAEGQLHLLDSAVRFSHDMVLITALAPGNDSADSESYIVYVNDAFLRHTQYTREQVIGQPAAMLLGADADRSQIQTMRQALREGSSIRLELVYARRDGSPYEVEVAAYPLVDEAGRPRHFVSIARDITERRLQEKDLIYRAFHDSLTGLPNRALFRERLERAMTRRSRSNEDFGLMYLDLDGFKLINDRYGHGVGDLVLIETARRLESCVRPGDTVARLAGDEFVILLEGIESGKQLSRVADRILELFNLPVSVEGAPAVRCTISIGMTANARRWRTAEDLLRETDAALYRAKTHGKHRYEHTPLPAGRKRGTSSARLPRIISPGAAADTLTPPGGSAYPHRSLTPPPSDHPLRRQSDHPTA